MSVSPCMEIMLSLGVAGEIKEKGYFIREQEQEAFCWKTFSAWSLYLFKLPNTTLSLIIFLQQHILSCFIPYASPTPYPDTNCYLDNIINVYLAVLVFVQRVRDAEQLVLRDALDLPHDADELIDANQVLPTEKEQSAHRRKSHTSIWWGKMMREESAGQ